MNIWSAREKSRGWLKTELTAECEILQGGFGHLNTLATLFEKTGIDEGESKLGQFSRIYSIGLAKFSHLLLGCYSLSLDGLAQESGALLRPLIETYELLVYFRQDNSRVIQVVEGNLPSAGAIGKTIAGDYKDLRTYLNNNASHFSYKFDSVRHLLGENLTLRAIPDHSKFVFSRNINLVNAFQLFMIIEASTCLSTINIGSSILLADLGQWLADAVRIFSPSKC